MHGLSNSITLLPGFALMLAITAPACAAPGNSFTIQGTAEAVVVDPMRLQALEDLRFGAIVTPQTSGGVTVDPGGAVSATGGVATNLVAQAPGARGPAHFLLDGTESRFFVAHIPNKITISNGTSTMLVKSVSENTGPGTNQFGPDGNFHLKIGGTLNVDANQEVGEYTGTFDVTVLYL